MTSKWDVTLEEVIRIKEECWAEVAHLPLDEAMDERVRRAEETTRRLGLEYLTVGPDEVFGHIRRKAG